MVLNLGDSAFSGVSLNFEYTLIMKSGLPVTVVVTVWSHGLYIEGRLFGLRHGAVVKC